MSANPRPYAIAGRTIGPDAPPYCIAEVGINHNGELALAKRMIEVAKAAGADAVKFQTFRAEEFCGDPNQSFSYQSQGQTVTESMLAMFRRYEFNREQWQAVKAHCDAMGITFFSSPQNRSDLDLLLTIGVPAVKIGSDDFTNLPLLASYREAGLPMILSCGMADLAEVDRALDSAGWFAGHPVALLLCTSQYPTPPKDVNVRKLTTLQGAFPGLLTGFSDHTQGPLAAAMAVALGARIFEKHFTLDKQLPGPDHWFSEDATGLTEWIATIRSADAMRGSPLVRPTSAEREMRPVARRSVVALRDLAEGETLSIANIGLRRPGDGMPPEMLAQLLGMTTTRQVARGARIALSDIRS
ncbi:MAG: N-acetylneuraminate synthase family protein [Burkholderiales bacterium]|nr:N-acetylneuraminate synthase family protein [Burkholderiales bacterium]